MKIRTQTSLGYISLTALLVTFAIYSILEIRWLNRINQSLTGTNFQARRMEIEELGVLEDIFSYDLKYLATQDVDYLRAMSPLQQQYEMSFTVLTGFLKSSAEQGKADSIASSYAEYKEVFHRRTSVEGQAPAEIQIRLDNRKYDLTQSLRRLYGELAQATHEAMQAQLSESEAVRRRAQRIAVTAGLLAVGIALVLSVILARQISSPLGKLIDGTRLIAAGKFEMSIPVQRRDEFGELAQAFNFMAQQLGQIDELKKKLLSHVSHELKSPLAAMREAQELLLSETLGPLSEKQRRLMLIHREKSEVLSRRINDLLDLSRIEAGVMEYQLEPVRIPAILHAAIESAAPLLRDKNLSITSDFASEDIGATVDSARLVQVMENLLANAIKFSRENSTIQVRCRIAPGQSLRPVFEAWNGAGYHHTRCDPRAQYVMITVEDRGIGILRNESRRIFEKFYQAQHGAKLSKTGTGLGLAICRSIIEAHDGVIWVESEVDQGSQFYFAIPTELPKGIRKSQELG